MVTEDEFVDLSLVWILVIHLYQSYKMRRSLIQKLNSAFPTLTDQMQKGNNGRCAVIGGSYQFTGAPYYTAISGLKVGGDLSHIFCSKASSVSIKSYSPEIIVHPVFISEEQHKIRPEDKPKMYEQWIHKISSWEKAIHSWVIGPGLGRDPYMQEFFPHLVRSIGKNKVVIFDADGIYYLSQHPQLFKHLKQFKTIITPNHRELGFLKPHLSPEIEEAINIKYNQGQIEQLPKNFNNIHDFTLLIKGQQDLVLGPQSFIIRTEGGKKRCGGIGDILAGVASVCSLWDFEVGPALASRIVRKATHRGFEKQGRGLTAPCIIRELAGSVKKIEQEQ